MKTVGKFQKNTRSDQVVDNLEAGLLFRGPWTALIRLHLEHCVLRSQVQKRCWWSAMSPEEASKIARGLEHMTAWEKRQKTLNFFNLGKWREEVETLSLSTTACWENMEKVEPASSWRCMIIKWEAVHTICNFWKFTFDIGINFFFLLVVRMWTRLAREAATFHSFRCQESGGQIFG